jgi:hypothetical protein
MAELKGGKHSHQIWLNNDQEARYRAVKGNYGFKELFIKGLDVAYSQFLDDKDQGGGA